MQPRNATAKVTPVRQRSQYTCMAASVMMCLRANGVQTDEDTVNLVMGAQPMKGASWEDALAAAQHYGMRATLVCPATLRQVKEWTDRGIPVMISWNPEGREWSHASVIFDVADDLTVSIADPNIPDPDETVRVVPKDEFYKKWYEKWPHYLVRREALAIEREITPDGRQVIASVRPSRVARVANLWMRAELSPTAEGQPRPDNSRLGRGVTATDDYFVDPYGYAWDDEGNKLYVGVEHAGKSIPVRNIHRFMKSDPRPGAAPPIRTAPVSGVQPDPAGYPAFRNKGWSRRIRRLMLALYFRNEIRGFVFIRGILHKPETTLTERQRDYLESLERRYQRWVAQMPEDPDLSFGTAGSVFLGRGLDSASRAVLEQAFELQPSGNDYRLVRHAGPVGRFKSGYTREVAKERIAATDTDVQAYLDTRLVRFPGAEAWWLPARNAAFTVTPKSVVRWEFTVLGPRPFVSGKPPRLRLRPVWVPVARIPLSVSAVAAAVNRLSLLATIGKATADDLDWAAEFYGNFTVEVPATVKARWVAVAPQLAARRWNLNGAITLIKLAPAKVST